MKQKISHKLSVRLSHLDEQQVDSLLARADQLRRRSNCPAGPLDQWVERVVKADSRRFARCDHMADGLVCAVFGSEASVDTESGMVRALTLGQSVVVGDRVTFAMPPEGGAGIVELAPRRTKLSRPGISGNGTEQVIAANIDCVVIVVSVVSPPLHPRLIDRYLVAVQQGGAEAAIFVNKLDLLQDRAELAQLDPYIEIGLPVLTGSAEQGGGFAELDRLLAGKVCAFVGHSGVGKSSIVNRLKPDAGLDVGAVSEGYGRGTHTTTTSSLHRQANGTVLIDTPGIRSFGLRDLSRDEIAAYFPEFRGYSCKFSDCSHIHEPGCGVRTAVESGAIPEGRFEAYGRLWAELARP